MSPVEIIRQCLVPGRRIQAVIQAHKAEQTYVADVAAAVREAVLSIDVTPHLGDEPHPTEVRDMAATTAWLAVVNALTQS
jgi:hypothetical protein